MIADVGIRSCDVCQIALSTLLMRDIIDVSRQVMYRSKMMTESSLKEMVTYLDFASVHVC